MRLIRWHATTAAAGLAGFELWWLYGSGKSRPANVSDHLVAISMFVLPILLIALTLALSQQHKRTYLAAVGVTAAMLLVLLLCLFSTQEFSAAAICFWISIVAWIGLVPVAVSVFMDNRRKA